MLTHVPYGGVRLFILARGSGLEQSILLYVALH